jgi:hypothetical protein
MADNVIEYELSPARRSSLILRQTTRYAYPIVVAAYPYQIIFQ